MTATSNNADKVAERTPLLARPGFASSGSSLSLSSSDSSDNVSTAHLSPSTSKLAPPHEEDEEARLDSTSQSTTTKQIEASASVARIVCVLLIGSLISNADSSLLFATHPIIASEFNSLHDSSWLLTSFGLAQTATLPLYGKLSDIYGRKTMLLLAYSLFAAGCALVGVGTSMGQIIAGRVISGAGASGMTTLISILITDLVPLRDVASWRSYVNIVATTGRSIGGPLGGWLTDTIGWRWSFLGQVPLAVLAIVLVSVTLPSKVQHQLDDGAQTLSAHRGKLARIDFTGALFIMLSILSLLVPLQIGGDRLPWSSPLIIGLLIAFPIFGAFFLATEYHIAREPIVPIPVIQHRDVLISCFVMIFQGAAQVGLMFAVPLYFQVTSSASNTVAGAHLVPAVFGNAIGGILSGIIIKRTGRYKALILIATLVSSTGYLLLILRWHGNTGFFESLYIFPGGFGMGIVQSALFIAVQAAIDPKYNAVAASTLYLASAVGILSGMAGVSATLQGTLRSALDKNLTKLGLGGDKKWEIIEGAMSDVDFVDSAKPAIAKAVTGSYVEALTWTHALSLACSMAAFVGSLFLRQHKL